MPARDVRFGMDPLLDPRKQEVLGAVVAGYTDTGVPVGSQILATRYLASWSSATIRHDLAGLVEIGYLVQPHTSAGRVPSDRGYRYYVNVIMEDEEVPREMAAELDALEGRHATTVEELLEVTAGVLARATESVALVSAPVGGHSQMKHLDFVALDDHRILLVVVLEGNVIRQQVVSTHRLVTQEGLSAMARIFNGELRGATQSQIRTTAATYRGVERLLLDSLCAMLRSIDESADSLVVHDGVRNLIRQPEFGDAHKLQQVLDVVEEEAMLREVLLGLSPDDEIHIVIGEENGIEELQHCSIVMTSYGAGEGRRGTIAALGSTRMRYSQVRPRLRLAAQTLGTAIERMRA